MHEKPVMIVGILSDLLLEADIYSADQEIPHSCEPRMLFLLFTNFATASYTKALELNFLPQCSFFSEFMNIKLKE
jgi:hypothetical protein